MTVYTKQIKDKWHSYVTFKGYDYSVSGATIQDAQKGITARLMALKCEMEGVKFDEPKYYVRDVKPEKPQIWYAKNRLDFL